MPSVLHPQVVDSVTRHIAQAGRLPLVDALRLVGPLPDPDAASAARVAGLVKAIALRPDVAVPAGPLLLVDARYRSGWSMTVAASMLRGAGATAVLPLVLHQLP